MIVALRGDARTSTSASGRCSFRKASSGVVRIMSPTP
jgi:hypothetical protein